MKLKELNDILQDKANFKEVVTARELIEVKKYKITTQCIELLISKKVIYSVCARTNISEIKHDQVKVREELTQGLIKHLIINGVHGLKKLVDGN